MSTAGTVFADIPKGEEEKFTIRVLFTSDEIDFVRRVTSPWIAHDKTSYTSVVSRALSYVGVDNITKAHSAMLSRISDLSDRLLLGVSEVVTDPTDDMTSPFKRRGATKEMENLISASERMVAQIGLTVDTSRPGVSRP